MKELIQNMMRYAIELAAKAGGNTLPNPRVGAVIFNADGKILGEGYHRFYGSQHAEVAAINDAASKGHSVKGSAMCVTLEPCNHHGKTGPCSAVIKNSGITKVYIGVGDDCKTVCGCGTDVLLQAGIDVETNILREECLDLNLGFHKYNATELPFVRLKVAMSANGRMGSKKFTSEMSQKMVHKLRENSDLIITGLGTIKNDDPSMNVRFDSTAHPKNVLIMDEDVELLDRYLKRDLRVFGSSNKVIIAACDKNKLELLKSAGINVVQCERNSYGQIELTSTLRKIAVNLGFREVMVEAGPTLIRSFLELGSPYIDALDLFIAPIFLSDKEPCFILKNDVYIDRKSVV